LDHAINALCQCTREAIRNGCPDVIHCHDPYAAAAALDAVGADDVPIVETVHGPVLFEADMRGANARPRYRERILHYERRAFAGVTRFIAVDSGQAAILRDEYGVDAAKITVVFNAVDVEDVRRLAEAQSALIPDARYFLVPRRLEVKTGVRYAIEALARLKRDDVQLLVAGQGPLRAELEELARMLGITQRVHFLGPVPRGELLPVFKRSAGVIIPSVPAAGVIEATALAATEAMACGTVTIASAIGGLAELITDGETGLLVPPADPDALAGAMTTALEDGKKRNHLIASATAKVEGDYSFDAWLRKTVSVYDTARKGDKVLEQHR
jgi:glycogen(starch) synthase